MEENRNECGILVGKPERKRPLRRPRCRWEDNIKMYPREIGQGSMDWTYLAQDRDQGRALISENYRKDSFCRNLYIYS
jgi:hypothetical protein